MKKKLVYIAHPIASNPEINIASVMTIFHKLSIENKVIPFVPYIPALLVLDDEDPEQRAIGFEQNKHFFENHIIDEIWVYGLSNGVNQEIAWANEYGITVVEKF